MSSEPSRSNRAERLALADLVTVVLDEVTPHDVVIVDGRSGAGKSTFARELRRRWPSDASVVLIALDDVYPGWDGLAAGAAYAVARVLVPRAAGEPARWQQWDWAADRYDGEHTLPASSAVILEGSGALTAAAARFATVRVWLDAPAELRKRRALDRDGETYRPHWERWAAQEDEHIRRDDPRSLATHLAELV